MFQSTDATFSSIWGQGGRWQREGHVMPVARSWGSGFSHEKTRITASCALFGVCLCPSVDYTFYVGVVGRYMCIKYTKCIK